MRVCVLTTDDFGGYGGIAKFNRDFLTALSLINDISVIDLFSRLPGSDDVKLPEKIVRRCTASSKLRYVLRVFKYAFLGPRCDVVFCGHINLLPIAYLLSKLKGARLELIVHGVEAWGIRHRRFSFWLAKQVDRIISVTRFTLKKMDDVFLNKTHFILPNSIDLDFFKPAIKSVSLTQAYSLENKKVLLSVGRLDGAQRHKGFDQVLEVLQELTTSHPDLIYVLVGDGTDRERLAEKAKSLGLSDHVIFTGKVSDQEKLLWYQAADAFVMCGFGEGFGIVYLEALACGLPVVGSELDGSREALMDGRLGLLANPAKLETLSVAINQALIKQKIVPEALSYYSVEMFNQRVAALFLEDSCTTKK